MKNRFILPILAALFVSAVFLASCDKESVSPGAPVGKAGTNSHGALTYLSDEHSRQDLCHHHKVPVYDDYGNVISYAVGATCCTPGHLGFVGWLLHGASVFPGLSDGVVNVGDTVPTCGENVRVKIYRADNTLYDTMNPDSLGHFGVSHIPAGTYTFKVVEGTEVLTSKQYTLPLASTEQLALFW